MLIVDDEPIICQGIRYTIPWDSLGIEVVGEAYSGEEALPLAVDREVDLVLTDIRMKGMDGLRLTELLKEALPQVVVIIISGYDDFEYARQAVRLGVTDYLLKPVDIDELVDLVSGIKDKLQKQSAQLRRQEREKFMVWLSDVVKGVSPSPEVVKSLPELPGTPVFRVIAMQMNDYAEWRNRTTEDDRKVFRELWVDKVHNFLAEQEIMNISQYAHANLQVTFCIGRQLDKKKIEGTLAALQASWQGPKPLYASVSDPFDSLDQAVEVCRATVDMLKYHVLEEHSIIFSEDIKAYANRRVPPVSCSALVQKMIPAFFQEDEAAVERIIDDLFRDFQSQEFLLGEVMEVYDELKIMLARRLQESGVKGLEHSALKAPSIDLHINNSYVCLNARVKRDMAEILDMLKLNSAGKHYWVIEKAKSYIAEHNNSDLKASEVAAWLKITPSYFSLIFKQNTGRSFTDYLNQMRIDQAKQMLLETHDKVFEIANKVGYKEYKYFVSIFKAYTGMTPTEFRDLNVQSK